ncbi:MAG TPA: 30S ribosome-binding factor RbfA [Spirochaetaceae bacterium]|nr:30S ribosome-binding factor RbfA [Spirochaetaceae bacterium]
MSSYSQGRLESKIMQGIGLLIVQREIKNPKISSFVSPTRVSLAPDNSVCTVYISSILPEDKTLESIEGLNQSKGFIQKKLASVLKTKNTPKLNFVLDESEKHREEIDRILEKIKDDKPTTDSETPSDAQEKGGKGDLKNNAEGNA